MHIVRCMQMASFDKLPLEWRRSSKEATPISSLRQRSEQYILVVVVAVVNTDLTPSDTLRPRELMDGKTRSGNYW